MGQRIVRINALLMREINDILRTRFSAEAFPLTVTAVDTAPDLRSAKVFYSVLGGKNEQTEGKRFFQRSASEIRRQLARRIVLKYLPFLQFLEDHSIQRGNMINALMDGLKLSDPSTAISQE